MGWVYFIRDSPGFPPSDPLFPQVGAGREAVSRSSAQHAKTLFLLLAWGGLSFPSLCCGGSIRPSLLQVVLGFRSELPFTNTGGGAVFFSLPFFSTSGGARTVFFLVNFKVNSPPHWPSRSVLPALLPTVDQVPTQAPVPSASSSGVVVGGIPRLVLSKCLVPSYPGEIFPFISCML